MLSLKCISISYDIQGRIQNLVSFKMELFAKIVNDQN